MKIAYFITGLGLGGAEIITIENSNRNTRFSIAPAKKTVAIHSGSGKSEEHHQAISS